MQKGLFKRSLALSASLLGVSAALLTTTNSLFGAGITIQDFSGSGGTPYTAQQNNATPAPFVSNGVMVVLADVGSLNNAVAFDAGGISSAGGQGVITAAFDYYMPDETAHGGCCGERADGFGFALLGTGTHGVSGPVNSGWVGTATEQDAFANALTVGFDIFTGAGDGALDDNNVRLGWNGVTIANNAFGPAFKLNNGLTNRVYLTVATNGPDLRVDMSIVTGAGVTQVVFNAVAIPAASVPPSRVGFAGRTGGAWTRLHIDNVAVLSGFNPGPAVVTVEPTNNVVTESQIATFSFDVDGTPPYAVQWYSNGVPIVGATALSYTTPVTVTNMNNTVYYATVTNALGGDVTANVVLTVNPGIIAQSVTTDGFPGRVRVVYNKPAALTGNYTLNNGATVNSVAYGATHSEVLLTTSVLPAGTAYVLTISGETGEDGSQLAPSPTLIAFTQVGAFCTDFTSVLPPNSTLFGTARMTNDGTGNNVIRLTDDSQNTGVYGQLYFSNTVGNSTFYGLQASWRTRLGGAANGNADGMSFNWAPDIAASSAFQAAEDGVGSYLSFTIDTWDQGAGSPVTGGPDTGIEIKWRGSRIAFMHIPRTDEGNGNFLARDVFVNTSASIDAAGNVSFTYDTNTITGTITNWTGVPGLAMNIGGRTGGEADNHWIDDLCVSNFTIGPVVFVKEPVNTAVFEGSTATFTAGVDGSPRYFYQWFTNGVPVTGATNGSYTTLAATEAMEGVQVSVNVSNLFSTVTSSNATLDVLINPRIVAVRNVGASEVRILWTRPVDLFEGQYTFDNNIFENNREYGSNHNEIVIFTDPMQSGVTYTITAENVLEEGNPSNGQFPNPASRTFRPGYGSFCTDFASLPAGTTIGGQAAVSGGFLHLTDMNAPGGNGWFFAPDPNAGFPVDRLVVTFKTLIGRTDANRPADGMSFNIGSDINSGTQPSEDGYGGQGLTVSMDMWDNGGVDTAPSVEILYKNTSVASRSLIGVRDQNRAPAGPFLIDINGNPISMDTSNRFANVRLSVGPDGKLDLYFKDYLIFQNIQLPNYTGFQNANIAFGARVGGASENHWVDDLCVNAFSIGAPVITSGPTNTTITELNRGKLILNVDGLPPYSVQWFSNGVAIAGATALVYDTPTLNVGNNPQYYAIVSNSVGVATSQVATVTVNPASVRITTVRNPDGSVTLSWPGAVWTLQATDELKPNPAETVWQNTPYTSPLVIPPGYFGTGSTNVFFRLRAQP